MNNRGFSRFRIDSRYRRCRYRCTSLHGRSDYSDRWPKTRRVVHSDLSKSGLPRIPSGPSSLIPDYESRKTMLLRITLSRNSYGTGAPVKSFPERTSAGNRNIVLCTEQWRDFKFWARERTFCRSLPNAIKYFIKRLYHYIFLLF